MKKTESLTLKAALASMAASFAPNAIMQIYFRHWLADCDAEAGNDFSGEYNANVVPTGILACTVSFLPSAVGNNNVEYVVTDSTVATNGGTVVGGGSTRVLVRSNNANWLIV